MDIGRSYECEDTEHQKTWKVTVLMLKVHAKDLIDTVAVDGSLKGAPRKCAAIGMELCSYVWTT